MGNWIHADESIKGRIKAIEKENQRLVEILRTLGVLRDNIFHDGWLVIYTEHGAIDIRPNHLAPCLKQFKHWDVECKCQSCIDKEIEETI